MNYHNNTFSPRQPAYNQWQNQSWNTNFHSNNNFSPRQPFPPFPNHAPCGPMQGSGFHRPQFQNNRHASPQYFQGGNRGGYGNFQGGPRVTSPHPSGRSFQGNWNNSNNSNNNPNGYQKSKKKKVDKRDLAENNNFFCDTCDRGFKMKDKYDEHVDGHQQCSVAGCPYVAAPKLVQLHFQLQHKCGLAKKVWSLESQKDVDKWIAERKKNFPTSGNIKKKEAEQMDRNERGEVLETKQFGKFRKGQFGNNSQNFNTGPHDGGRGSHQGRRGRYKRAYDRLNASITADTSSDKQHNTDRDDSCESPLKKRNMDCGSEQTYSLNSTAEEDPLSQMVNKSVEKEETKDNLENEKPVDSSKLIGGLAGIIDSYNSDGEAEINKGQTTLCIKKNECEDSFTGPNKNVQNTAMESKHSQQHPNHPNKQQAVWLPRKRVTLLERLLAQEIRHERNVVLQCVYYIVKKTFFARKTSEMSAELATELEQAKKCNDDTKSCCTNVSEVLPTKADNSNDDTCCINGLEGLATVELESEVQRADNSNGNTCCSNESKGLPTIECR